MSGFARDLVALYVTNMKRNCVSRLKQVEALQHHADVNYEMARETMDARYGDLGFAEVYQDRGAAFAREARLIMGIEL